MTRLGGSGSERRSRSITEENKALARRAWEIVSSANLDLLEEVYAPDLVWHEPDQDVRGIEEGKRYVSWKRNSANFACIGFSEIHMVHHAKQAE
jgi:hypothetical protein